MISLATKKGPAGSLSGSGSPEELADRVAEVLSTSTRADLGRLVSVSDSTIALAAGWERVRRTMPETDHEDTVSPDLLAICRFLGLIEGRLEVPIPRAWEESVKSAAGRSQKSIWFKDSHAVMMERAFEEWTAERAGKHWVVKKDNRLIRLPADDDRGTIRDATVQCVGETAYVALYGFPDNYRVCAVDQRDGQVKWSSNVWGTSLVRPRGALSLLTSGGDWHHVTMRASAETLVVFGCSGRLVYLEAFDRRTGENRCRFSTAYFERIELKK